jgi:oligoribonuclease
VAADTETDRTEERLNPRSSGPVAIASNPLCFVFPGRLSVEYQGQATDPEPRAMTVSESNLVWIDLEMTGLDPQRDQIIEIATVVTDAALNELAQGPVLAIHQPDALLDAMDEWNTKQHGGSGLTERVRNSRIDLSAAQRQTMEFLAQWVPPEKSPMCGNSICQDRRFLARLMPELEAYFHYRNLDVSTVKELARRWAPPVYEDFKKDPSHLALDDIRDSIAELRHYRDNFLKV